MSSPAILALEDGTIFTGTAVGAQGSSVGEVVFNTGTNAEDEESAAIWAAGLVIRDLPLLASNFRNQQGLQDYLEQRGIVAIADIRFGLLV